MRNKRKDTSAGKVWILKNSRGQYGKGAVLSLLCMGSSAIGVVLALALKEVVDGAVNGSICVFRQAAVTAILLILMQIVMGSAIRYLDERSRADLENTIKRNVWMKLMTRDYGSLEQYHTGELMNRLSNDVKVVADNMVTLVPSVVSMLTRLLCVMVILFMLDWRFAAIFFSIGTVVIFGSALYRGRIKWLHKAMQAAEGQVRSFQQEMLESMMVIRSFKAEEKISEIGDGYMQEHKHMRLKKNMFSNLTQTGFSVVMNAGYLFGIIWCGFGILEGRISYGTLLAVQQLVGQVQQPIAGMANIMPRYYAMTASAERLIEIEELTEDDAVAEACGYLGAMPGKIREIFIENVTIRYRRESESVLKNASIRIKQGDVVAVTGESGAGKSTLLKALLCLYPLESGAITVCDEAGGRYLLSKNIRNMFAYVPQGNFLMSGTIREVVSMYGMTGCMTVEQACKIACAGDYIEELEKQYDTRLGERGVGLSEGQMQRLAIARALYMGAPVLLLDEATSALDGNTEVQVLENIRRLQGKIVIIVTHRPAALAICNRKVEIKNGMFFETDR